MTNNKIAACRQAGNLKLTDSKIILSFELCHLALLYYIDL